MPSTDRPNVLFIMSDEHGPMFSGTYGHPLVQTPNMARLAANGVTFNNAYCNSPLCMPSRMSFITGRYIHHVGTWDNATPLRSDAVTWAHLLRAAGYDVVLSGKQHFGGLDQLHGFRAQLARDLHAENRHGLFDWSNGTPPATRPWGGLEGAGPGTTAEIEVDDLAEEQALVYLRHPARKEQPWALNVSFIAPHFPLVVPQRFWDLYPLDAIDLPEIPSGHLENQHPVYKRMRSMFGCIDFPETLVRRGRAGYYGLITYLDEKIGRLLDALEETDQLNNTVVVYTSDHGEMNGEHGMWRKSNFYEASARIPLQIAWPGHLPAGRRIDEVVSLVDVTATLLDIAGAPQITPLDGDSLVPLMQGDAEDWKDEAFSEYLAHGVARPMAMLRRGRYKFNYSLGDPPELYDLQNDSNEFHNLAEDASHQAICEDLQARLLSHWNPVAIEGQVRQSQKERLLMEAATDGTWRKPVW
ncbi:MAG: sulfatase-like hydrolase/transferase [Candidatus Poribacteria bacterium]|nr:sulfatase-like hydrolase/transferase [Candidatus Poribacteria bacterium]